MKSTVVRVKPVCRWGALLALIPLVVGCASTLRWARDTPSNPSCVPDRLLSWNDFTPRDAQSRRGAETAIRFHLDLTEPPRIQAQFDPELSWVKPEVINAPDQKRADRLLRHEQVHFAISCLLTRQANLALRTGGDPKAMLLLLNAVATRINVQYDVETNHGVNASDQARWEEVIESSLAAGPLTSTVRIRD
ncbi:MAG TPA: hypothetical protein VJ692_09725 [Nitrospiraceae bacterium]|nr:hypothetical protein [Nitrospiraceae bacterium]